MVNRNDVSVEYVRGGDSYIVKYNGVYYLVSLDVDKVSKAFPPEIPDKFLKFGYFEEVDELSVDDFESIMTLLQKNVAKL